MKNPFRWFKNMADDIAYDAKEIYGAAKDTCVDAYNTAKDGVKSAVNWVDNNVVEPVGDFVNENVVEPVKDAAEWVDDKLDYVRPASKADVKALQEQVSDLQTENEELKSARGADSLDTVTDGSYSDAKTAVADALSTEDSASSSTKSTTESRRRLPNMSSSISAVAAKAASIVSGSKRQLPQGAADIMAKSELGYGDSELQAE